MVKSGKHRRKLGLFGGTFDPVHIGHMAIAEQARACLDLDMVIFVPSCLPPHKPPASARAEDRFTMVSLAVSDNPFFHADDCELRRGGASYTYDTVTDIKSRMPDSDIYCVIGSDSLPDIHTWHKSSDLAKEVVFAVAIRPGHSERILPEPVKKINPSIIYYDCPLLEIASSAIREAAFQGRSIRYLVPEPVKNYIQTEKIYAP